MQQFALASVYPRSIAWLVRLDEWDRFEEIVHYNCAMVGGYFNVIIPLTGQDSISEEYQRFLIDYDPDLVVLAPGMTTTQQTILPTNLHPFGVIPWESVSQIATLDPWVGGTGINATLGFVEEKPWKDTFVSVADDSILDTSRLSLVACGDVSIRGSEHKEHFLQGLWKDNMDRNHTRHIHFETLPSRYELANIIANEYSFPLSGTVKILDTCIRMQHHPDIYRSLIGLTATYGKGTRTGRLTDGSSIPGVVIQVSEKFDIEEATSFWNLRAGGIYVMWMSFSAFENSLDEVTEWLNSEYVRMVIMKNVGNDVVFSTSNEKLTKLKYFVEFLLDKKLGNFSLWHCMSYEDTIFYSYNKPSIIEEQVTVVGTGSHFAFVPKVPEGNIMGEYKTVLKWDDFMLPYCFPQFIQSTVSDETVSRHLGANDVVLPRFRVTRERYLAIQNMSTKPIEFNRPTVSQIINALFADGGFSRVEQSSTAKYHTSFINRCGTLTDATYFLTTSPYRELFEVLADNSNSNKKKAGWILDYPAKRRALHHLHLRDVLSKTTPTETKSYFNTVSDELPTEAFQLLEKGLLERGFQLSCIACSYKSWYPAEHVGQTFECSRCFQTQVYNANPLWLYKLPEVVFRGFEDNMQVPLLALDYLRRASKHSFEWVPDSNVYIHQEGNEAYRNIDILCISDGKLYIGEAKSNDVIGSDQFSFYEQVCKSVAVDGIVFATSQTHWSRGTQQRIDSLKAWFRGEVLIVTEQGLYFSIESKI